MPFIFGLVLVPPLYYIFKYKAAIRERINDIELRYSKFKVIRDKTGENKSRIRCLELHPKFVEETKDKWQLISLGQYLSQLRSNSGDCDKFLKKELELTIGKALLSALGRTFGAALLPILSTNGVDNALSKLASNMASYATSKILSDEEDAVNAEDVGAFDISLPELIAALNINQKINNSSTAVPGITAMDLFRMGEVGSGELSFYNEKKHDKGFPSPFVIERDFKKCIADMEEECKIANPDYDSDDKSLPPPTLINERILPDLYSGSGDAKCTHSKRECIENRFMSFLLTRLAYNYTKKRHGDDDLFEVHWNGTKCRFPEDLVQAFIDNDHKVEVCPKATTAVFGTFLCVKEEDGSFSNIPVCAQLRTGVEDTSEARPSYFVAPHGGMELNITGPLIGTTNYCAVQFYVSAEGFTGFFANQDVDVPFLERIPLSRMYTNREAVTAIRMAAMVAHVFNSVGTDMNLPYGGYGILGMCNDSSTLIDYAIRGETSSYPLLATGRYLNHIFNYLVSLKEALENDSEMLKTISDLEMLIKASIEMPNDLHISPSTICDSAERFAATYSKCIFKMTGESKVIMANMAAKYKKYGMRPLNEKEFPDQEVI